jgi:hypothetical protein
MIAPPAMEVLIIVEVKLVHESPLTCFAFCTMCGHCSCRSPVPEEGPGMFLMRLARASPKPTSCRSLTQDLSV